MPNRHTVPPVWRRGYRRRQEHRCAGPTEAARRPGPERRPSPKSTAMLDGARPPERDGQPAARGDRARRRQLASRSVSGAGVEAGGGGGGGGGRAHRDHRWSCPSQVAHALGAKRERAARLIHMGLRNRKRRCGIRDRHAVAPVADELRVPQVVVAGPFEELELARPAPASAIGTPPSSPPSAPAPHRPLFASGRLANGHSSVSSAAELLEQLRRSAGVKPLRVRAA